jgi:SAM-dependent methyltransferase
MKTFLHVGCGPATKDQCPNCFRGDDWREIRLDIDPAVKPDIIGSITAMAPVADASMDALYSSHNLEHLYAHEVEIALREFHRVLKPQGFAVVTCPDLKAIAQLVVEDRLLDVVYTSPDGPVTALDMIYGYRGYTRAGNHFMAHRCGFTATVLLGTLAAAGFASYAAFTVPKDFAIWAVARKDALDNAAMRRFMETLFP